MTVIVAIVIMIIIKGVQVNVQMQMICLGINSLVSKDINIQVFTIIETIPFSIDNRACIMIKTHEALSK